MIEAWVNGKMEAGVGEGCAGFGFGFGFGGFCFFLSSLPPSFFTPSSPYQSTSLITPPSTITSPTTPPPPGGRLSNSTSRFSFTALHRTLLERTKKAQGQREGCEGVERVGNQCGWRRRHGVEERGVGG